jgi:hypothetical protein
MILCEGNGEKFIFLSSLKTIDWSLGREDLIEISLVVFGTLGDPREI